MSSIGNTGGPGRNAQTPTTPETTAPRKKKGFFRKIADVLDPKREPIPVVTVPPSQGVSVDAAVSAVRGHQRPAAQTFGLSFGSNRLNTALERAPNDSRRALVVQELQRLRPEGFARPTSILEADPAAEWADRLLQNEAGMSHLLVGYLVRLYPDTRQRGRQMQLFDALRTLARRDPAESNDVVDMIARMAPQGNVADKALVKGLAAIKYERRDACVQFARQAGFATDGAVIEAANHVKPEHLPTLALCVSRLCASSMLGEGVAKVVLALNKLHRQDRAAITSLVQNLGANNTDGNVLADLIKSVAHIKEADRGCLTFASEFASASSGSEEWYRIIHAFTQVREADRADIAAAAKTLTRGLVGTQDWPTIVAHLSNMSGTLAGTIAVDAANVALPTTNGLQRAQIAARLATIIDPEERRQVVRLGHRLMEASTALFTNHHPLVQLLQTPVSEREVVAANALRLCPAGTPAGRELESVMKTLRQLPVHTIGAFTDLATLLVRPESADRHYTNVIEKLASQRSEERQATVSFVQSLLPRGASEAGRQQLVSALMNVPASDRGNVLAACEPLLVIDVPSLAVESLTSVIGTPSTGRAEHAQMLIEAYHEQLEATYDATTPAARVQVAERIFRTTRITPTRVAPRPDADRRIFAANQRENVMNHAIIARVKSSIAEMQRLFPHPPARGTQFVRMEAYLNTYPTNGATIAERAVFNLRRGGATEKKNALRVINDRARDGDYTQSLRQNDQYDLGGGHRIGLGDLAELVWFAIESYNDSSATPAAVETEKSLMRYSFFKALSQCIEDDGHRVCGVGFTQRIVTILQGRVPGVFVDDNVPMVRPQQVVTFVTERFAHDLNGREPSADELRRFFNANVESARNLFGRGTPDAQIVEDHLSAYFEYEYTNWQAPAQQAQNASFNAWRGDIEQRRRADDHSPDSL